MPGLEVRSIKLKVIDLTRLGFEHSMFGFSDLPKWDADAVLIWPSGLAENFGWCLKCRYTGMIAHMCTIYYTCIDRTQK